MAEQEFRAVRGARAPTHPGALLRDTVLPSLDLTVKDFAARLGVTRQQVHRVLSGDSGVSPDMALRLGKLCGNGPDLWLNMQRAYDLWQSRQRIGTEVDRIATLRVGHRDMEPV